MFDEDNDDNNTKPLTGNGEAWRRSADCLVTDTFVVVSLDLVVSSLHVVSHFTLALVVQKLGSAIQPINHYAKMDNYFQILLSYPIKSDLSSG